MGYKLSELVARFGGRLVGADVSVEDIAPTNLANSCQITFLSDSKYKKNLAESKAAAIIITEENAAEVKLPHIITPNPYLYFSQVSNLFHPRKKIKPGIANSALIAASSTLGANPAIAPNVVIGDNCCIGDNCQIFANVVIGDNVIIGNNVTIYPNVTIYDKVTLGSDCVLHAGCVIGSDGFGNAKDEKQHYQRIPQIGGVIIGSHVEIGANTTVDCGTFEPTIIEEGARIDNLVQIAHNVTIGAHSGIAAQVGIAGNSKIGRYCMLGGNAGIADHISICDFTIIGASSNVGKDITKPALYSCGMTVMEYKAWAKTVAHIRNLNKLQEKIRALTTKLEQLEGNN